MEGFVTITEATRIMGVSRWTVYRLIADGKLPAYTSSMNRRVKLVKRSDLDVLMQPQPIEPKEGKAAA
jgi:excisionase family DNA binding protein